MQRHPAEPESFDIAGDRARRHAEIVRQLPQLYPLAVEEVEPFDQRLLALNAPQREVPVARGCSEFGASVHNPHPNDDISLSSSVRTIGAMTDDSDTADEFFTRYAAALLARDAKAIASMYAVPSLILFPGQSILVSEATQTEDFFASSWSQYQGVDAIDKQIVIMGKAPGSLWADVTWSYGGKAQERFCYQLVAAPDGYRIAVLTPMA